jgi:putative tricarboxylic transport membrane protein
MFNDILNGLVALLDFWTIVAMVAGTCLGICLGALPGIGATLGIALAIPFTYGMGPLPALALLAGIHNGSSQGGAIPAILLRIPGTPGSIVTSWDGYPLAEQGKAGGAINLSAVSCAVGGSLSALSLILLAPPLAKVALAFGPPEIFWVNVFGIATVAALLGDDMLKGLLAACFGLLIGTVGLDNVSGHERYTFGLLDLVNGISVIAVMVGMFSFPPAWNLAVRARKQGLESKPVERFKIVSERIWTFAGVWRAWAVASFIGIINGILPGSAIASFIAYAEAKRISKTPEMFGKGSIEGLAAAECVNAADNASALIPTLTLGVPGSNVAALILGALLIQGFQPGPQLFKDAPTIVYGYSWALFFTSLLLIPLGGALASRVFANVLKIPTLLLLPLIIVIACAGCFASQNSIFDVYMAAGFGLIGLAMIRFDFPIAPVIIGVVLGAKAEFNLRVSLMMSSGDYGILLYRPICIVMILLTAAIVIFPLWRTYKDWKQRKKDGTVREVSAGH